MAAERHSGLEELNAEFEHFGNTDPSLLAEVVAKMEKVDMNYATINSMQVNAIFKSINSESKLKRLFLAQINLSSVNPEILSKCVVKIEEIDFCDTNLNTLQLAGIFCVDTNESNIKKIAIRGLDLSKINPKSLAKSIAMMQKVDILDSKLTTRQYEEIFKFVDKDSNLTRLNLEKSIVDSLAPTIQSIVESKITISTSHYFVPFE